MRKAIIMCRSLRHADDNYFSDDRSTGSCHRFRSRISG